MNGDGQSFEANFMKDVRLGAMEAEKPKKSFSVSPKIVGIVVLILVLVGVLVALTVMKGDKGGNGGSFVGTWSCENGSEITFSKDGGALWASNMWRIESGYVVEGGKVSFGDNSAGYDGEDIVVTMSGGQQSICKKEANG